MRNITIQSIYDFMDQKLKNGHPTESDFIQACNLLGEFREFLMFEMSYCEGKMKDFEAGRIAMLDVMDKYHEFVIYKRLLG